MCVQSAVREVQEREEQGKRTGTGPPSPFSFAAADFNSNCAGWTRCLSGLFGVRLLVNPATISYSISIYSLSIIRQGVLHRQAGRLWAVGCRTPPAPPPAAGAPRGAAAPRSRASGG